MSSRDLSNGRPVRVAIVGVGSQGMGFLHALRLVPEQFEVVGVADVRPGQLEQAARRYEVTRTTSNWREFLEDRTVDLMYFGTPGDQHSENALAALAAGKHVYIEKPVTCNTNDARQALELAREHQLTVMVCMNVRQYWPFPIIKRFVDDGLLGDIFFAQQDYLHDCRYVLMPDSPRFWSTNERPINFHRESAIHPLDTLVWLLGPIKRVWAQQVEGIVAQRNPGLLRPSDCVSLELEFCRPNMIGRSLTNVGYIGYYAFPYYSISLYGTEGTALPQGIFLGRDNNQDYEQVHDPERQVLIQYTQELHDQLGITSDIPIVPYEYQPGDPSHVACHLRLFKLLLPALRRRQPVDPGLGSNARLLAVLEAAQRSLETAQFEVVDYTGLETVS
ncbi:MAG: Gfo/Idh/MocA family oxidoreductase [Anaerolineae bacterium]|nr:Gfo/Idh/MocA family oxidoreductase [Anaerolineae bacterium]